MRVIGGTASGVPLEAAQKAALRPMLDRVKESLFNILRNLIPDARVLDLFSGSGSLGLEALSRGARVCTFVESDRDLVRLIAANARKCRLQEHCRLVQADVLDLPKRTPPPDAGPADLVLVDPPYAMTDDPNRRADLFDALEEIVGEWITTRACLVLHHSPLPGAIWPARRLVQTDQRIYGRSQLTFFDVEDAADE